MSSDRSVPWETEPNRLHDISGGVALAAAAIVAQLALPLSGPARLLTCLAAVLVASRWLGRLAGLTATAVGVAACIAFMSAPGRQATTAELVPVALLAIVGLGVAWWTGGTTGRVARHERENRRLKDEFLANVSHELRTPLNAILGWIQLLRLPRGTAAGGEVDQLDRGLEVIERNARRQLALVEDLLVAAGPPPAPDEWQRVDLRDVVGDLMTDLADTATGASVTLQRTGADVASPALSVSGDRAALRLALRHIVANAIKFTPSGGRVRIELTRVGDRARVAVSDTGAGIDPKLSRAFFEPFRQRDGSSSRLHGGMGLGLTVAQRLIEGHRGQIEITSGGDGHGATVVVSLPAAASASALPVAASSL